MKIYTNELVKTEIENLVEADQFETDYTWHYLFILHHIRTYKLIDKKYKTEEFVPVNVKELRSFINYNNAHKILKNLVHGGIVETDNYFRVGNKSKFYKISEKYNSKWFLVEVEDKTLIEKFKNRKKLDKKFIGQNHVIKCLDNLKIKKEEALNFIESRKLDPEQKEYWKMQVEMFENKFSVIDSKGFRLHSNLTNLAGDLRAFLYGFNGLLSQIDIKCSQPTFLALKIAKIESIKIEERKKLLEICEKGVFYEYIFEKELVDKELRKEVKKKVFSELLFNKNYKSANEVEKIFKKKFPSIFKYIVESKEEDYRNFPILLQRQESDFIFSVVSNLTHLEIYTIHDSIVTCRNCIEEVKQEMLKQFKEKYNISPNLTVENLQMSK